MNIPIKQVVMVGFGSLMLVMLLSIAASFLMLSQLDRDISKVMQASDTIQRSDVIAERVAAVADDLNYFAEQDPATIGLEDGLDLYASVTEREQRLKTAQDDVEALAKSFAAFQAMSAHTTGLLEAAQERSQLYRLIFNIALILGIPWGIFQTIMVSRTIQKRLHRVGQEVEAKLQSLIGSVREISSTLANETNTVSAHAEQSAAQSQQVGGRSEQLSASIGSASNAASHMSDSIGSIVENIASVNQSVQILDDQAQETNELVGSLSKAVEQIDEVLELIHALADKTNLLSLNAAIEAARAGDAGAGFAVVAEEVKKLADQTSEAVQQVSGQVGQIQGASAQAIEAVYQITSGVGEVGERASTIATAIEEQNTATVDISNSMVEASSVTNTVSTSIKELAISASTTGDSAGKLLAITQQLQGQSDQLQDASAQLVQSLRKL